MLFNISTLMLSVILQIAAAVVVLRMVRITRRSLAWMLLSTALVGMSLRRVYVFVQEAERPFPSEILPNEILGLMISILMLGGVILTRRTFVDQAEQKRLAEGAEARARTQAQRLRTVMEAVPTPIWIAEDATASIILGNPAAAELLRMPVTENVSKTAPRGQAPTHFRLCRDGVEIPAEDLPMQRAVRGESVRDEAMDLCFEDGQTRRILAHAEAVRNPDGSIAGGVCAFIDVTDVLQARDALRHAQKLESLGMMAGGIAHDFNNIFQGIRGNLELARMQLPLEFQDLPHLRKLDTLLERASLLSRDLLHYSGGELRRPEALDLSILVGELLKHPRSPVTVDLVPGLPLVQADPELMRRVLQGLLSNALEADPGGGQPRLRTYVKTVGPTELTTGYWPQEVEPGPCVVLEVADQGQGIPAGSMHLIFDPFYSTRGVGRGLGLAAVLGIIRGHHGGIQVESIEGIGSVFRVLLPCRSQVESSPAPALERGSPSQGSILLADDDRDLREALAEMLRNWFHLDVVEAQDGQEALETFRRTPDAFRLVLLDATMPRLGGVEAFQAMRQVRPGLRAILCSGYTVEGVREQALAQGFSDFLNKPFSSQDLQQVLGRAGIS